ncbi:hypothetical protein [Bosea psychrotolerans]|uniref:Uncharacterized protein n=1 Tax=Bosea psychrotolerans TaxID=1871628 RepID=A0A2S4MHQ0_9HYPH|nr:hypothetical protein [Bosea psychrotolerans]POR54262.1 hypothetical protein CYD53_103366 [Bosea psychrotolerans]
MPARLHHWVGTCPLCRQGRLILLRNDSSLAIYAHCEECEQGYQDPANIDTARSFLTLDHDYETSDPSLTEIARSQWHGRVRGSFGQ